MSCHGDHAQSFSLYGNDLIVNYGNAIIGNISFVIKMNMNELLNTS